MRSNKNKRLNLGLLVDKPFPHPSLKDRKGIINLSFDLSESVYEVFYSLVAEKEYVLGEKALKAAQRIKKRLQIAFSTDNKAEYLDNMGQAMDSVVEARFWVKEIQMKYIENSFCDEAADRANELIAVLSYISESVKRTTKADYLTVN